jgi:hypothetical protein
VNEVHRDMFNCTIRRSFTQNVNPNDMYGTGTLFESQPEHKIFLVYFFVFFHSHILALVEQLKLTAISSFRIEVNLSL